MFIAPGRTVTLIASGQVLVRGAGMLICVPEVLGKGEVAEFRRLMDAAEWEDGRSTAGAQSALVKRNEQLPPRGDLARHLGERVLRALTANPLFVSAAVPLRIFPPLFNRYGGGHHFGIHVDNAVRGDPTSRACASAQIFQRRCSCPSRRIMTAANW